MDNNDRCAHLVLAEEETLKEGSDMHVRYKTEGDGDITTYGTINRLRWRERMVTLAQYVECHMSLMLIHAIQLCPKDVRSMYCWARLILDYWSQSLGYGMYLATFPRGKVRSVCPK